MFEGDNVQDYYNEYKEFTAKDKQIAWRYEISIEGYDLTLYAYTVGFSLFEISQGTSEVATMEKSFAERLNLRTIPLTIFDDDDGPHQKYFLDWKKDIIPMTNGVPNGLYRLPNEYTRKLKIQLLTFKGEKKVDPFIIKCWPVKVGGDLQLSKTESKLLEFPIELIEQKAV